METGTNILNYKGDANLGLAENTDIPVIAEKPELSQINQAADQLRLFDHQNNIMLYQQKIKDRDASMALLAQGKVQSGKILPEDQKFYDEAEKAQTEAWKGIKGLNDKDGIANYLTKTQQLQDLTNNLQHRWVEVTKLEGEKSKQSLPKDIQAYADHIAKQRSKKVGELIDPFQKSFSGDFDDMAAQIKGTQMLTEGVGGQLPPLTSETKTTTTDKNGNVTTKVVEKPGALPVKGKQTVTSTSTVGPEGTKESVSIFQKQPDKYYDYPTMLKRAEQLYLGSPEQSENQRQWFTKFHEAPAFIQEDLINKYNQRIKDYSTQRGLQPDANGRFQDEIKFKRTPDGKLLLQETPSSFAAKHTLATIEGDYVEKGGNTFNESYANYLRLVAKDKADMLNDRNKLSLEWSKFNLDRDKFNAANKEQFADAASIINEATSIINKGEESIIDVGGGKTETVLRIGDPTLLATFGNIDKDGKVTNVPNVIEYNKDKDQVNLVYYDGKTESGKNVIDKKVPLDQRTWLKHIAKRSNPNKELGLVNSLVDEILLKNKNSLSEIARKSLGERNTKATYTAKMPDGSFITSSDGVTWYDKNGKKVE